MNGERGEPENRSDFAKEEQEITVYSKERDLSQYFNRQERHKNIGPINQAIERDLKK